MSPEWEELAKAAGRVFAVLDGLAAQPPQLQADVELVKRFLYDAMELPIAGDSQPPSRSSSGWAAYAMRLRSALLHIQANLDYCEPTEVDIHEALVGEPVGALRTLQQRYPDDAVVAVVAWTPDGNLIDITAHLNNDELADLVKRLNR